MKRGGAGMSENKNAKGMPRPGSRSSEDKPVGVPRTCARWHISQPEKPLPAWVYQQCQQIRELLGKRPHALLRPGRASVKTGGASRPGVGTEDGNAKPRRGAALSLAQPDGKRICQVAISRQASRRPEFHLPMTPATPTRLVEKRKERNGGYRRLHDRPDHERR